LQQRLIFIPVDHEGSTFPAKALLHRAIDLADGNALSFAITLQSSYSGFALTQAPR
jgi:hypothetical protein